MADNRLFWSAAVLIQDAQYLLYQLIVQSRWVDRQRCPCLMLGSRTSAQQPALIFTQGGGQAYLTNNTGAYLRITDALSQVAHEPVAELFFGQSKNLRS